MTIHCIKWAAKLIHMFLNNILKVRGVKSENICQNVLHTIETVIIMEHNENVAQEGSNSEKCNRYKHSAFNSEVGHT